MPALERRGHLRLFLAALVAACLATGCVSKSPRVVRIGFVAPFEGRYREIGDEVIPAARLAVRDYASRYPDNHLVVELVAYDDEGVPAEAVAQAKKLVADPAIGVVIGHWRDETTAAALPIYERADIPMITFTPSDLTSTGTVLNLSPSEAQLQRLADAWNQSQGGAGRVTFDGGDDILGTASLLSASGAKGSLIGGPSWALTQFHALVSDAPHDLYFVTGAALPADTTDATWPAARATAFIDGFKQGSLGAPPGMLSLTAYEATWLAIQRIASRANPDVNDTTVSAIRFDASGRRVSAPVYLYRWDGDQPRLVKPLQ